MTLPLLFNQGQLVTDSNVIQHALKTAFIQNDAGQWISPDAANDGLRRDLLRGGIGQFDGSGHSVLVGSSYSIPAGASVVFECYVRFSSLAADQMLMYSEAASAAGGLGFKYDTATDRFEIVKAAIGPRAGSTLSCTVDTWCKVKFEYNMTSGAYAFTVDDRAAGSGTDSSVPTFDLSAVDLGQANATQMFIGDMAWCKLTVNGTPIFSYDFSYNGTGATVPNLLVGGGAGTYDGTLSGDAGTFWGTALEVDTETSRNRAGYNYNLVIGSDVVTNGDFATDTDWTKGTGWTIGSGTAQCDGSSASQEFLTQDGILTVGKHYRVRIYVTATSVSGVGVSTLSFSDDFDERKLSSTGQYEAVLTAISTDFKLFCNSGSSITVDDISIVEVTPEDAYIPRLDTTANKALPYDEQLDVLGNTLEYYGPAPLDLTLKSGTVTTNGTDNTASFGSLGTSNKATYLFYGKINDEGVVAGGWGNNRTTWNITVAQTVVVKDSSGITTNNLFPNGYSYGDVVALAITADFDGSGETVRYWVDGVEQTATSINPGTDTMTGKYIASKNNASKYLNAEWYKFAAFDSILTDQEIAEWFTTLEPPAKKSSGDTYLVFGETSGTTAYDTSGNGNHGTWAGNTSGLHTTSSYQRPNNNVDGFNYNTVIDADLLIDPSFAIPSEEWRTNGESTVSQGSARILSTAGVGSGIFQEPLQIVGRSYRYTITISDITSGKLKLTSLVGDPVVPGTVGTHVVTGVADSTLGELYRNTGVTDVTVTRVQIDEVTPEDVYVPASDATPTEDALGNALEYAGDDTYLNGSETTAAQLPNASELDALAEELFVTNPWFDGSDDPNDIAQSSITENYEGQYVWTTQQTGDVIRNWIVYATAVPPNGRGLLGNNTLFLYAFNEDYR